MRAALLDLDIHAKEAWVKARAAAGLEREEVSLDRSNDGVFEREYEQYRQALEEISVRATEPWAKERVARAIGTGR